MRKGKNKIKLKSGNLLYHMSEDDNSSAGVGFRINKKEEKHVITTQDNSNHVAYIVIKLK